MTRWCDRCNNSIDFMKVNKKWIPIDANVHSSNYGSDHRKVCKPDPKYIAKRNKIIKDPPLQIDGEFY